MRKESEVAFFLGTLFGAGALYLIQKSFEKVPISIKEKEQEAPKEKPQPATVEKEILSMPKREELTMYNDILKKSNYETGPRETIDEPFQIDHNEFEMGNGYTKFPGCTFYTGNEVLADFGDNKLDISDVGGVTAMEFGRNLEDPDVLYIRNDALKTDYEICRDPGEWAGEE